MLGHKGLAGLQKLTALGLSKTSEV